MRRFLGIAMGLIVWLGMIQAQSDYRAIISQGRVYSTTAQGFHQIEAGELVADSSKLELVDGGMIILMDEKGRFVTLNNSGKYSLRQVDLALTGDSSVTAFQVWEDFYEYTSTLVANSSGIDRFELSLPSSSEAFGYELILPWRTTSKGPFRVELYNEFEEIILSQTTNQSRLNLDLLSKDLAWRRQVFIKVTDIPTNRSTRFYALAKLSPRDSDEAKKLISKLPGGGSIEAVLTKAAYFEQRGWIADVHTLLIEPAGENEIINNWYQSFLSRNGFNLIRPVRR